MTSTAPAERPARTAPVAGDQAERVMLGRHEDRIADPLPIADLARAALAWLSVWAPRFRFPASAARTAWSSSSSGWSSTASATA